MRTVKGRYGVTFGKCDSSDWIECEIELTDEESEIYDRAVLEKLDLNELDSLKDALCRAYEDIEYEEICLGIENEDEYVMECQGEVEMDTDELNELVLSRDPYALSFFHLEDASNEELGKWDAEELENIPLVKDFDRDFEPTSPFNEGWSLNVEFIDPNYTLI